MTWLTVNVPPYFMQPILDKFDAVVDDVFLSAIAPTIACSEERKQRATLRASLPSPFGCSLFRAADQGRAAWLSSLAGCLSDPILFRLRSGLNRFVEPAWNQLVESLQGTDSGLSSRSATYVRRFPRWLNLFSVQRCQDQNKQVCAKSSLQCAWINSSPSPLLSAWVRH
jgi:hypothetical protein